MEMKIKRNKPQLNITLSPTAFNILDRGRDYLNLSNSAIIEMALAYWNSQHLPIVKGERKAS